MNTFEELWQKLSSSKEYREELVAAYLKRSIPFQIKTLRKQREWPQDLLAENAKVTQGVVSRAEDPDYGNLTINTILRMGAGLDLAFIGKFVPFSEFAREFLSQSESSVNVPSFEEETRLMKEEYPISFAPAFPQTITISASGTYTIYQPSLIVQSPEVFVIPKPVFVPAQIGAGIGLFKMQTRTTPAVSILGEQRAA